MSAHNFSRAWLFGIALVLSALAQVAFRQSFEGVALALSGLCVGAVWLSVRAAGTSTTLATCRVGTHSLEEGHSVCRPEEAATRQPRATPWVSGETQASALKGRNPETAENPHPTHPLSPLSEPATLSLREATVSTVFLAAVLVLQALDADYLLQVILWIAAIAALHASRLSFAWLRRLPTVELALFGILVATALLLRIYDLEFYPTGMHGDEGSLGLWALRVAQGEAVPPFAVGWDFHPTLFHYGQASAMRFAGLSAAGNRLFSAVLGSMAILPLYLFLRRQFGSRVALAGAALQAVMPWHLYFSRVALNDIGVGLCALGAMAAFFDSAHRRDTEAAAGTWLGLSLYFGNKAVMVPAMMAAGMMALHATGATNLWREWRRWCLVAVVAIAVAAPQLAYYARTDWYGPLLHHPLTRFVGQEKSDRPGQPIELAAHQVQAALLALQARPDRSIFLSFTHVPLLPMGMATLYFVGLALCLCRWRQPLAAFLLAWLVVGLLASMLTINPPQAHRLVPMISVPIVLAALALAELKAVASRWRWMPVLLLAVVVGVSTDALSEAWHKYAAPTPWMEVTEIARAVQRLDATHDIVLVTAPMADSNGTLQFFAGDMRRIPKLYQPLQQPWRGSGNRNLAFLVSWRRYDELPKLKEWYPNGREYPYATAPGASFLTVYEVPR